MGGAKYSVVELTSDLATPSTEKDNMLQDALTHLRKNIGELRVSKLFSVPAHLYLLERISRET